MPIRTRTYLGLSDSLWVGEGDAPFGSSVGDRIDQLESVLEKALEEVRTLRKSYRETKCLLDGSVPRRNNTTYFFGTKVLVPEMANRAPLFTDGGSTKGLRDKIKEVLRIQGMSMTSAQLAEAIYVYDPKVSFDLFKRRVIVAASAMYRDDKPSQLVPDPAMKGKGREVYWLLPEQIQETALLEHAANQILNINDPETKHVP